MTKQEIIDVIFKDPEVIKNLKDNKLEECLTHLRTMRDTWKEVMKAAPNTRA